MGRQKLAPHHVSRSGKITCAGQLLLLRIKRKVATMKEHYPSPEAKGEWVIRKGKFLGTDLIGKDQATYRHRHVTIEWGEQYQERLVLELSTWNKTVMDYKLPDGSTIRNVKYRGLQVAR